MKQVIYKDSRDINHTIYIERNHDEYFAYTEQHQKTGETPSDALDYILARLEEDTEQQEKDYIARNMSKATDF